MALPKINLPISELILPSTGEKIKTRSFTVKEEKILLIAGESNDAIVEMMAIKQIINNCLVEGTVDDLAMIDLEYVFLKLRSSSVDNLTMFTVKDPETGESVELELDIDKVECVKDETHSKEVRINEDYVLYLKHPTIDEFAKVLTLDPKDPLTNYFIMCACLDKLASDDEVHNFSDYTPEEIDDFMDGIDGGSIKQIQKFFETLPKLRHEIKYTNSNGNEQTFVIEGIRSFFI
ncbi:MAG: T4 family baseplate hub assembly chaperone [Methylophagaceae bacterium]